MQIELRDRLPEEQYIDDAVMFIAGAQCHALCAEGLRHAVLTAVIAQSAMLLDCANLQALRVVWLWQALWKGPLAHAVASGRRFHTERLVRTPGVVHTTPGIEVGLHLEQIG